MNIEEAIKSVREVYVNLPRRYEELKENLSTLDREIDDIEHFMEFNDLNLYRGFMAYKDLQRARRERRLVKNEMELLKPILELNKFHNKPQEKQLNKALGDVRLTGKIQRERKYKMRVREDLQEFMK